VTQYCSNSTKNSPVACGKKSLAVRELDQKKDFPKRTFDLKGPKLNVFIRGKILFVGVAHLTHSGRSCLWVLYYSLPSAVGGITFVHSQSCATLGHRNGKYQILYIQHVCVCMCVRTCCVCTLVCVFLSLSLSTIYLWAHSARSHKNECLGFQS